MGELFQGNNGDACWGQGAERYRTITGRLTSFALAVRSFVMNHHGELIYAGGDDALSVRDDRGDRVVDQGVPAAFPSGVVQHIPDHEEAAIFEDAENKHSHRQDHQGGLNRRRAPPRRPG